MTPYDIQYVYVYSVSMCMFNSVHIQQCAHTPSEGCGGEEEEKESLFIKQYQLIKVEGMIENHCFITSKAIINFWQGSSMNAKVI